jgi:hypothetical protein
MKNVSKHSQTFQVFFLLFYLCADVSQFVVCEVSDVDVTSPLDLRKTTDVGALRREQLET